MSFERGNCPEEIYKTVDDYVSFIITHHQDRIIPNEEKTDETHNNSYANIKLTNEEKKALVEALKTAYDREKDISKVDILVPASEAYCREEALTIYYGGNIAYSINYKWDKATDSEFDGPVYELPLEEREYDRIGAPTGTYLSPVFNGVPYSCKERALPYYIPEEPISNSPSYHKYYATRNDLTVDYGKVAPMFDKGESPDGGAFQVRLKNNKSVGNLRKEHILNDSN